MAWIDGRGRLFGIVNIIDAGVGLFFLLLLAFGLELYRIATYPTPVIERLEPSVIEYGTQPVITVHGRHFDRDTVVKLGQGAGTGAFQLTTYISSVEIRFTTPGALKTGPYTLLVANRANKMARYDAALTVTSSVGNSSGGG